MINLVSIIDLAKTCTPAVARAARNIPKMQKTVTSLTKMAECAKGSQIGELLASVSETGQRIVGHKGIIEFEVQQAKNCSDATIIRAIFKKGHDIVGKFVTWVSPNKQKVGAFVNNSSYHFSTETLTQAEKFEALAKKLGVDIKTANQRMQTANGAGAITKDEQTMADIILGKYAPKMHKHCGSNFGEVVPTTSDSLPLDAYISSGYNRLILSNEKLAEKTFKDPVWQKLMSLPKCKESNSPLQCKTPLCKLV